MNSVKIFFSVAVILFSFISVAAPFPVTSTSILTDPSFGLFYKKHGFSLKSQDTAWVLALDEVETVFETYRYKLKDAQAVFSLRLDKMGTSTSLESYTKKWMREYPQYGFEILNTKTLKLAGGHALLVDLYLKSKAQQVRQLILNKSSQVVILTCTDQVSSFQKTLPQCNRLMNSFQWD